MKFILIMIAVFFISCSESGVETYVKAHKSWENGKPYHEKVFESEEMNQLLEERFYLEEGIIFKKIEYLPDSLERFLVQGRKVIAFGSGIDSLNIEPNDSTEIVTQPRKRHRETIYNKEGNVASVEQYVDGTKYGISQFYHANGEIRGLYDNAQGIFLRRFHEDGWLIEQQFPADLLHEYYYNDGALRGRIKYRATPYKGWSRMRSFDRRIESSSREDSVWYFNHDGSVQMTMFTKNDSTLDLTAYTSSGEKIGYGTYDRFNVIPLAYSEIDTNSGWEYHLASLSDTVYSFTIRDENSALIRDEKLPLDSLPKIDKHFPYFPAFEP